MKTGCYTDLANDRTFANELCCSLCECHIRTSPCDIVSNHVSPALATTRRGAGDIDIASSLMVFYRLVAWIFIDRPEQIKKRVPITSKEVREDRTAFYDWLASQGSLPERRRKGKHSS